MFEVKMAEMRKQSVLRFKIIYDTHPMRTLGPVPLSAFDEIHILALSAARQSDELWPVYFSQTGLKADHLFRIFDLTEALVKPSAKSKARGGVTADCEEMGAAFGLQAMYKDPTRQMGANGKKMDGETFNSPYAYRS